MSLSIGVVISGAIIGVLLGALGGGGSILAVPALVYLGGYGVSAASAISLVAVGVSSLVSMVSHLRRGNVKATVALTFIAAGVPASALGHAVHERLADDAVMLLFSGIIALAAYRMLTACPSCTRVGEANAVERAGSISRARAMWIVLAGSGVGFLTGLFGVGGGFVVVPALTLTLGFSMPTAIGTSLLVVAGNAAVSLGFRGLDSVDVEAALPFVIVMMLGSVLGAKIASRIEPVASLRVFAGVLVAAASVSAIASSVALWG